MKFVIPNSDKNQHIRLRELGYAPLIKRNSEMSYVRRLRGNEFPRFHLYVQAEDAEGLHCTIHLDQRAPVYERNTAHAGDYDSPEVVAEVKRLTR